MRKLVLGLLGASALAISSAASAVVILPGAPLRPGSDESTSFITTPVYTSITPSYTGPIGATIGHSGIAAGDFTDMFEFTIGSSGMGDIGAGSGSLTTGATIFLGVDDLDLTSVIFNNGVQDFMAALTLYDNTDAICGTSNADRGGANDCGISEAWTLTGVPIIGGNLNTLTVNGTSYGDVASYGGHLSFTPNSAVPEPATWAMMLLGFAGIGFQLRRKRGNGTLAQFA